MYEAKTRPTGFSVTAYLAGIADVTRRKDCKALAMLMRRVTGSAPRMWGAGIVGFGSYHYKYASGHEGDSCVVGFSSRKGGISVYLVPGYESAASKALLSRLGTHKIGKACLYLTRLSDIKMPILEQLIVRSVAATGRLYPLAIGEHAGE